MNATEQDLCPPSNEPDTGDSVHLTQSKSFLDHYLYSGIFRNYSQSHLFAANIALLFAMQCFIIGVFYLAWGVRDEDFGFTVLKMFENFDLSEFFAMLLAAFGIGPLTLPIFYILRVNT
jgi:hypothetical protein